MKGNQWPAPGRGGFQQQQRGAQPAPEEWQTAPPPAVSPPPVYPAPVPRDWAYAVGSPLLKLASVLSRVPLGFLLLIAGWGLSVPAWVLTRGTWPQAARIALSVAVFAGWVALIVSEAVA